MNINLNTIKKIHFIGIGGIGLSAIARFMKEEGKEVSGSDLSLSLVTEKLEKLGIKIQIGQSEKNISQDIDLIIYTTAIPKNNSELRKAKELGIKMITYPESLGLIFNNKFGIAVCGTHGKSSVSAMAGLLLDDAKLDPSIIVGSILPRYKSNLRVGKGEYFIAEACEYERSFLSLYPRIIILNNIELDHTDYYKDIDDMKSAFEEFVSHLPENGTLIINGDSPEISNFQFPISSEFPISNFKILKFGLKKNNDIQARDVEFKDGETKFKVIYNVPTLLGGAKGGNKDLDEFVLKVPGLFNVYNALGVIALGLTLEVPADVIKKSLANYLGIWRRFEIKGEYKNALVVSDYAHHPTAVKATIEATKQFYPGKRIFVVFQPHQHNRTKELYKDFLSSFNDADTVILSEVFDVRGREETDDQNISSLDLVNDIKKWQSNRWLHSPDRAVEPIVQKGSTVPKRLWNQHSGSIFYAKDLKEARKLIDENIKFDDILLIMGAGDIYKVADDLVK
ncbi:MAG: UDP-N-acetylmuramate--L-alanine ligase [Patescibacteria group bacterium]|nr:UDP-N-acetylmuramate--L-alanine ligase [Patescibacteria group bacterium]